MKKTLEYLSVLLLASSLFACESLENMNVDPNSPQEVPSHMLMSGAEKWTMDNIYDVWFSGRQCLAYAQQWTQRNYTEEDRYQIRESVNNGYFNYLYMGIADFDRVIKLNTDPATAGVSAIYGANANQIAAARIMKVWTMGVITDTWGAVPYSEIGKLESDGLLYAKYDDQKSIYAAMIKELTEAAAQIDEKQPAFTSGDIIYGGDASKWKKFANSLKCRLAVHLSKVDPAWKTWIAEALKSGVFESNDDAAKFTYSAAGDDYCKFYEGYFIDGRNDFTITRPLVDLMKGQPDTLNAKKHPWEGVVDPRLQIYTSAVGDIYRGIPYAAPTGIQDKFRSSSPNWYSTQPLVLQKTYSVPLMTYAELKFILCEYKGYDAEDYKEGVKASIDYWYGLAGGSPDAAAVDAYVKAVSGHVDAEACAIQKYIDLFTNGTEAWTEIRRTGYPDQLLRPGELTCVYNGKNVKFSPLNETRGLIIPRVKYPTNESTLNGENWKAAVAKLDGGTNNYSTQMFWDVRKSPYDHPADK